MTEILYMKDVESNYIREFDAGIVDRGEDYVVLDRTAFYAEAGGQPTDKGVLRWDIGESAVRKVRKDKGTVRHFVDSIPSADEVRGILDWERRHALMRMHTAQHVVSGTVFNLFEARTVGNQIHANRSRIDFHPVAFEENDLRVIEETCNEVISKDIPVSIYEEDRGTLEEKMGEQRYIMDLIPKSIQRLRVIQIGDFDICPCGGTHVKNTSELGKVHIMGRRSKGSDKERLTYELV
ncbi:MAG: alanyl-tRNA editing protein [Thermoplasmata archaeon]